MAVLWWHPLAWWALKRLRAASEVAADEVSVLLKDGPFELASCLVALGKRFQGQRIGWLGMAGNGFQSDLGRRVKRLLALAKDDVIWRPRRGETPGIVALALVLAGVLLGMTAGALPQAIEARPTLLALAQQALAPPATTPVGEGGSPSTFPSPTAETNLLTRSYKLNYGLVLRSLDQPGVKAASGGFTAASLRRLFAAAGVDWGGPNVFTAVGEDGGAGFQGPNGKALFFNPMSHMMFVRGTASDFHLIDSTLEVLFLTRPLPMVLIEARFVEIITGGALDLDRLLRDVMPRGQTNPPAVGTTAPRKALVTGETNDGERDGAAPGETPPTGATNSPGRLLEDHHLDWLRHDAPGWANVRVVAPLGGHVTAVLAEPQYRALLKSLQKRSGINILDAPRVTTLDGRQALLQTEQRTVAIGANREALVENGRGEKSVTNLPAFHTKRVPVGPSLEVIPIVEADGRTIHLKLWATMTEFLGYEKPAEKDHLGLKVNGKPALVEPPLPSFRVRQATMNVRLDDGQTAVLSGMSIRELQVQYDEIPWLAHVPLLGRLFRRKSEKEVRRNLVVFITATLIDPAGNRIHPRK